MQTKSKEDGGKDARVHNFYICITQENYELWQQCSCHQCCFQKRVQLHHPTQTFDQVSLQLSLN